MYIKFSLGLDFLLILRYTVFMLIYSIKALKLKIIKAIKQNGTQRKVDKNDHSIKAKPRTGKS